MKTISQQQRAANKINAQESTGPRTPEGKDRSRRNALKHGLLAKSILINEKDPNEDPADFHQLLNELRDDLKPRGALEQLLTQRLAVSYWRLRRAYRFEAVSICEHRRDGTESLTAQLAQGISGITRDPADFVLPSAKDLEKLIRYETLIDRELNRTMLQLQRLQRDRKTTEPPMRNVEDPDSIGEPNPSPSSRHTSPRQTNPNPPLRPAGSSSLRPSPRSNPARRRACQPASDPSSSPVSSGAYRSVSIAGPVLFSSIPMQLRNSLSQWCDARLSRHGRV